MGTEQYKRNQDLFANFLCNCSWKALILFFFDLVNFLFSEGTRAVAGPARDAVGSARAVAPIDSLL